MQGQVMVIILVASMTVRVVSLHGQTDTPPVQEPTLTLVEAVERGLSVNPRTAAAYAQEKAAAAGVRVAGSTLWPRLSTEGTTTRFQEAMIVAPLHEFDPTAPPTFARTLFQSRWTAAYTLFDGGSRRANIRAAEAANLAAGATTDAVEMSVIEAVSSAYLSVVAMRELRVAEERRLASLERERARVQQLFEVGRTPRVSSLRAEAALANARASMVATEQQLDASLHELARLLSAPIDSVTSLRLAPVIAARTDQLDADQLIGRAVDANPSIAMARYDTAMKRAAELGARAAWLPKIDLSAGIVTYAGTGVDITGEWQGGVKVSYPIFTGGARVHRIAAAAAAREAAESSIRARELEVAIGIDRLVSRVLESRARVTALTAAETHAAEVARIEQLALSAGAGIQSDFLRAEADLFATRADMVRATHAEVAALISLASATGDLSLSWLQEIVEN